jgi:hypothetical protein
MVEVLYYEQANKNKTIGYVDIRIPILKPTVIVLRKVSHVQSGDRKWFNYPSFSRDHADGTPNYLKFFEFETQVYNAELLEGLNKKVDEFCQKNGIKSIEPMGFDTFPEPANDSELPF